MSRLDNDQMSRRLATALAALENMRRDRDAQKRMVDMLKPGLENAIRAGQSEIERVVGERDEARSRVKELERELAALNPVEV